MFDIFVVLVIVECILLWVILFIIFVIVNYLMGFKEGIGVLMLGVIDKVFLV